MLSKIFSECRANVTHLESKNAESDVQSADLCRFHRGNCY